MGRNTTYAAGFSTRKWSLYKTANGQLILAGTGGGILAQTPIGAVLKDSWITVAYVRTSSSGQFYINGVASGSPVSDTINHTGWTDPLFIGGLQETSIYGYIDEVRVSNVARYSTAYTPASEKFTSDANTLLLLHMDTQDLSGDGGSGTYHIPNFIGTAQLDTAQKLSAGGYSSDTTSLLLDGNSDYISIPDSADWDILANTVDSWNIDCWVKRSNTTAEDVYFLGQGESAGDQWSLYIDSSHRLHFLAQDPNPMFALYGGDVETTDWTHVAFIKIADEYGLYVNGTQVAYVQDTSTNTWASELVTKSRVGSGIYPAISMAHLRIQKSNILNASPVVGLTDTITVPTAPYSTAVVPGTAAITGTATDTISEPDIVAGGKTIIITLTDDTWAATVGADNAITTALIAGIDSAQSEATGWDAVVKAGLAYTDVTRTSDTVVTILLPAFATYDITAQETITVTIPATAVASGGEIVASPTFTIAVGAIKDTYMYYASSELQSIVDGTKILGLNATETNLYSTTTVLNPSANNSFEFSESTVDMLGVTLPSITPTSTSAFGQATIHDGSILVPVTRTTGSQIDVGGGTNLDTSFLLLPTFTHDITGDSQVLFISGLFNVDTRSGTVSSYGTDYGEFFVATSFQANVEATYSGGSMMLAVNGVQGAVTNECTLDNATSDFNIANFGSTVSIDSVETITNANSVSVENVGYSAQIITTDGDADSDTVNKIFSVGTIETSSTHNASIWDSEGYGWYNVRDNAPIRLGAGDTGGGIETYGNVEIYYDSTDWQFDIRINTGAIKFNASQFDTDFMIYGDTGLMFKTDAGTQATYIGDGGTTNYAMFATDGEFTLAGTARVSKNEWINVSGLKAPGTKPATLITWGLSSAWEFTNGTDDTLTAIRRLPQDMDRTVAPEFKIGFASATNSGDVVWQLEYLYRLSNEDTTAVAQETLTTTQTISSTANGLTIATITGMDLPSDTDQLLIVRIKRLGADGADTLADDCVCLGAGIKYVSDKLGVAT